MAVRKAALPACFTMRAAIWLVRPWNDTTLPSPTSLSTDMLLPSPKVAPSVVSMVQTFEM